MNEQYSITTKTFVKFFHGKFQEFDSLSVIICQDKTKCSWKAFSPIPVMVCRVLYFFPQDPPYNLNLKRIICLLLNGICGSHQYKCFDLPSLPIPIAESWILDFPAFKTERNKYFLVKPPSLRYFIVAASTA